MAAPKKLNHKIISRSVSILVDSRLLSLNSFVMIISVKV